MVGCSGEDCVTGLDPDCTPAYPPTFEDIHARTFAASCAIGGRACHASEGRQGGLDLSTIEKAFGGVVSQGRVVPGDPACSTLIRRTEGVESLMPPSAPLREAERCAIQQWIRAGAAR